MSAYMSPFKVYCLAHHVSVAGHDLMWFVYGVWRGDPHPSNLQATPGIPSPAEAASTRSLLQTKV